MHHFYYPLQDTYVSNKTGEITKNFGITEILCVGTETVTTKTLQPTKTYYYDGTVSQTLDKFNGIFSGSWDGNVDYVIGHISGSNYHISVNYFSGSVDGNIVETSGVISGSLDGIVSGSLLSYVPVYITGVFTSSAACMNGIAVGTNVLSKPHWETSNVGSVYRSMLKFDISSISKSIADGTVLFPKFNLKLKVCQEIELPIEYSIYALPISQSWNMGDGYWSDGGSDNGASWKYRNGNNGLTWYDPYNTGSRPPIDFIHDTSLVSQSFSYGGCTFYTSSWCSQSFNYQTSDINMDVTPMVLSWISGSIANEGVLLIHSSELYSTGSTSMIKFFSQDTNTIYSPLLDMQWVAEQEIYQTGSVETGSVEITTVQSGIHGITTSGSIVEYNPLCGIFGGNALILSQTLSGSVYQISAFISGSGISGSIVGMPIISSISGSMTTSSMEIILPENVCLKYPSTPNQSPYSNGYNISYPDNIYNDLIDTYYVWTGDAGWSSTFNLLTGSAITCSCSEKTSVQMISASFLDGAFSGSSFIGYYSNGKLMSAKLCGVTLTNDCSLSSSISIPLPSPLYPYANGTVNGTYLSGSILGTYTLYSGTSASFIGQIIDGNQVGTKMNVQITGSVATASFQYTSSITTTTNVHPQLNTSNPFRISIRDLQPTYKSGDIIKINVFSRQANPQKTFDMAYQPTGYTNINILPTSSFYALQDNDTGEIILDFDEYTKLSCDYENGNYFLIDTSGVPQERYYNILIKIIDSQSIYTIDTNTKFKLTR